MTIDVNRKQLIKIINLLAVPSPFIHKIEFYLYYDMGAIIQIGNQHAESFAWRLEYLDDLTIEQLIEHFEKFKQ